jgi:SHS2 domain-containing protein
MSYKFLEHTADVKFRAEGSSLEEAFSEAALALSETVRGTIVIESRRDEVFSVEGTDIESLLHNFLEELLFLLDSRDFLMSSIKEINIDAEKFKAEGIFSGDSGERYKFTNDVKAVTFNEMFVKEQDGRWVCQVVLDV